jgi:hypothetical protein
MREVLAPMAASTLPLALPLALPFALSDMFAVTIAVGVVRVHHVIILYHVVVLLVLPILLLVLQPSDDTRPPHSLSAHAASVSSPHVLALDGHARAGAGGAGDAPKCLDSMIPPPYALSACHRRIGILHQHPTRH